MLISVVIPTCNRNDLLSSCLKCLSFDAQKLDASVYEVIVTDDGKENSAKNFIEKEFSWVKWVSGPKRGPASNRNNGAKNAVGEWVVFFDDDCQPDSDVLQQYINAIVTHDTSTVFEGAIYCSEMNNSPLYTSPVNADGGFLWSCNFCINKEIFTRIGGFDENFIYANLEDNDLHYRLTRLPVPVIFIKEARVNHPPRISSGPAKFAQYHESWFYYHKKIGDPKSVFELLKTILLTRIKNIRNYPLSKDSLIAFKNLLLELWYTSIRYGIYKTH